MLEIVSMEWTQDGIFERPRLDSSNRTNSIPIRTQVQTFLRASIRNGRNQNFSNLNPKVTEIFLKGQERIHQKEQMVFNPNANSNISASFYLKGKEPEFLESKSKSEGNIFKSFFLL